MDNTNVHSKNDVHIKDRVYNWVKHLCTNHNISQVKSIPVMITREHVSSKFSISTRHATRILNALVDEGKLYKYKIYNNIYIYNVFAVDISKDILVRVKL